jgi:exonuclease SbcD
MAMRILHTSDWHAGRVWKGVDRLGELQNVLDHLAGTIERAEIDLVLVTGDVFDHGAPPAEAERTVFEFFKRVGRAGVPSVVIAGNHDSPARLEAWGTLAELVHVHTRGLPRPAARGGVIEVATRTGEVAVVAAVPFAPVGRMLSALDLAEDDTRARQKYAGTLQRMLAQLALRFRADTVNLVMAHTHLDGAVIGGSERAVHVGSEWAGTPQALPSTAHYVALGHIHRPQRVEASPAPACYAGSALQLDFGEAGQVKTFNIVEVRAGRPARVELVPYDGGVPLADARGTLAEIEAQAERWRTAGHVRVVVQLPAPDPDVNRKVRALLPNALSVDVELPARERGEAVARPPADAAPGQLYEAFHLARHQVPAPVPVRAAFDEFYAAASRE